MVTLNSCPVCNSYLIADYKVISGGGLIVEIIPGVTINAQIVVRYCVCRSCSLIFQNPRLSDAELGKYYSTGFYRKTIKQPPEGMDAAEKDRAKIDTKIIRRHLGEVGSHLDIGCGQGHMLDAIGAAVRVGTESDLGYVAVKGVKVYKNMSQVRPKKFDLVSSLHVLEHVPHPLVFLKQIARFVKKDGYLLIEVPSWKTRGGPLGFVHLSHFEPDVLKIMCLKAGLKVIETEFTPNLILICKLNHA